MAAKIPTFPDVASYYTWANVQVPDLVALKAYTPAITDVELAQFQTLMGFIQAGAAAKASGTGGVALRTVMLLRGLVQEARIGATLAGDAKAVSNFQALEERMNSHIGSLTVSSPANIDITRMQVRARRLDALTHQLGGLNALLQLPTTTLATAFNHPDDVLAVSDFQPVFEIGDLVLSTGYAVFDAEHDFLYALDNTSGLTSLEWGRCPEDVAWLALTNSGDYGYLLYQIVDGSSRVIQLIRQ